MLDDDDEENAVTAIEKVDGMFKLCCSNGQCWFSVG